MGVLTIAVQILPKKRFLCIFVHLQLPPPARNQNYGSYSLFKSSLTTHFSSHFLGTIMGVIYMELWNHKIKKQISQFSQL